MTEKTGIMRENNKERLLISYIERVIVKRHDHPHLKGERYIEEEGLVRG